MPVRNYTSKQNPRRSAEQIMSLLSEHHARRVSVDYEGGAVKAIEFGMMVGDTPVWFRLEPDVQGMLAAMRRDPKVTRSHCTLQQAERTAWKNELEWLHLSLAKVAEGQARIEQLLFGYAVDLESGQTLFQVAADRGLIATSDPSRMLSASNGVSA